MNHLGLSIGELSGFTCCPEKSLIKPLGEYVWELAAARNLATAEKQSADPVLITPCNGCSSTLKSVEVELKHDSAKRKSINERLSEVDLAYRQQAKVVHLIEFLHRSVGTKKISDLVTQPFKGMRVATHPGCHFASPSESVKFDNPLTPQKFDDIVRALGAEVVDYDIQHLCCGQDLAITGSMEDSLQMARHKITHLQSLGIDALVVCCPACFLQFDQRQFIMARQGEDLRLPVFYVTELMALAFGYSPEEIGLGNHRMDVAPFLDAWGAKRAAHDDLADYVDLDAAKICHSCQACLDDCPVCKITPEFEPQEIIKKALDGKLDELLDDGKFWMCVQCHTCYEMCPQRFGMEQMFAALRKIAMKRGIYPVGIEQGLELFEKSGRLAEIRQSQRKKLGLDPVDNCGFEELAKLLKKDNVEKSGKK